MTQGELYKLTVGSTVKMTRYPIFIGKVTQINGKMVEVDYPSNDMTLGSDPQPFWEHFMAIDVVSYAEIAAGIPEVLKNAINNWQTLAQNLLKDIAVTKELLKL